MAFVFIGFTCKNDNVFINKTPKKEKKQHQKNHIKHFSLLLFEVEEIDGVANVLISSDTFILVVLFFIASSTLF